MTHDEFVGVTHKLVIKYHFAQSPYGDILIAATSLGICSIEFADSHNDALLFLHQKFPYAEIIDQCNSMHHKAVDMICSKECQNEILVLHIRGTDFQIRVWESLLMIDRGKVATYGQIAKAIGQPKASRAVGTAIAANPISILIPCHRVIPASGGLGTYSIGNYRRSPSHKALLLDSEKM